MQQKVLSLGVGAVCALYEFYTMLVEVITHPEKSFSF